MQACKEKFAQKFLVFYFGRGIFGSRAAMKCEKLN
jgi:hypothetical protein